MTTARLDRALDVAQGLFRLGHELLEALRKKDYTRVDEILASPLPTTVELLLIKEARARKKDKT